MEGAAPLIQVKNVLRNINQNYKKKMCAQKKTKNKLGSGAGQQNSNKLTKKIDVHTLKLQLQRVYLPNNFLLQFFNQPDLHQAQYHCVNTNS